MHATEFPNCCGMGIILGFAFDRNREFQAPLPEDAAAFIQAEGFKNCNLIALTSMQRNAQALVLNNGYVALGKFRSTHGDGSEVTLFAKGLTAMSEERAKPKEAPRPKRVRVVRIAARKGKK